MSSLRISNLSSSSWKRSHAYGAINTPRPARVRISLPKVSTMSIRQVQAFKGTIQAIVRPETDAITTPQIIQDSCDSNNKSKVPIQLYAILKAVAESFEMHKNIGEQQNNRNSILLNSINITMVRLNTSIHKTALKATSILLMIAAKGMLLIKNTIQASQQKAITLFKKLQTNITNENQMKVLKSKKEAGKNGWSPELEKEMREILEVVKRKEMEEYERRGNLALKITKTFAILGPLLVVVAAIGSAFARHGSSWAGIVAAVAKSLADWMQALEGMVIEMCKNCGGMFKLIEDTIEATLEEKDYEKRENGELFEMKVARKLGRSVSQLRRLASKLVAYDSEGISMDELSES